MSAECRPGFIDTHAGEGLEVACAACTGATYSSDYACKPCPVGTQANADHSACTGPYITRIAGTLPAGYSGDGGSALLAQFRQEVSAAAAGANGDVVLASYTNVRRVTRATGAIANLAGVYPVAATSGDGGAAAAAKLWGPSSVLYDQDGSVLIGTVDGVRRVDVATGIISRVAGIATTYGYSGNGGLATAALFNWVSGLAWDTAGNLIVADRYNSAIRKVDKATGVVSLVATLTSRPMSVAVDAANNIYAAEETTHRVRKIAAATAAVTTVAGTGGLGYTGDGGQGALAALNAPRGILVAGTALFVADSGNRVVRKVDLATGVISTVAGKYSAALTGAAAALVVDGTPALDAELGPAFGLALDSDGGIIVTTNYVIYKINSE